jgi:diguanylate cyclase (GGDEF)-like protein
MATHKDPITGLYNKRAFDKQLMQEVNRSKRSGHPLSLAIAEVDWFENMCTAYNEDFGGRVLSRIADVLQRPLRTTDFVARIDDTRFAIILPNTSSSEAVHVLNACCEDVRNLNFPEQRGFQASASIGISNWQEWFGIDEVRNRAIAALAQAQMEGRDRVAYSATYVAGALKEDG